MTNTYSHASRELDILFETTPTSVIREFESEILALCEKFGRSGQSGASAPLVAKVLSQVIEKLCLQLPVAPITGEDHEWADITSINNGESMYQNNRDSRIFKDGKDGKAYFIDAMIKKLDNGQCWHGWFWKTKEDMIVNDKNVKIPPRAYIKSFPFTPKTFYIDIIDVEVAKDDWESYMVDPKQLDEVYEYYDMK